MWDPICQQCSYLAIASTADGFCAVGVEVFMLENQSISFLALPPYHHQNHQYVAELFQAILYLATDSTSEEFMNVGESVLMFEHQSKSDMYAGEALHHHATHQ